MFTRTLSKGLRLACVCLLCSDTWGPREEEDEAGLGGVTVAAAHMNRLATALGAIVVVVAVVRTCGRRRIVPRRTEANMIDALIDVPGDDGGR